MQGKHVIRDVKMEMGDSKEGRGEYGADWAILISVLNERY